MSMTEEEVRRVSAIVRDEEIRMVSFFNLGEPFLSPHVFNQLSILRSDNPKLRIIVSSNGALLDTDLKRDAALFIDELYFSIDGVTDTMVNAYQRGGSFTRSYRNLCDMVRHRNQRGAVSPHIEWKYVVFNWNDHPSMIRRAIDLARAAGVDAISFWPTMNPIWGTSLRYRWGSFFKTVGEATWKGREIRFPSDR
jgi:MoaA/NifB/PqqE/SkfB family radical SAM enzyme